MKMVKAKKKTKSSKKTKAKKVKKGKPKKRYLIRELTAFIESKGPDRVKFDECKKLAKEIKKDTTYNPTYHSILVARIRSHLKKATPKKKK